MGCQQQSVRCAVVWCVVCVVCVEYVECAWSVFG